ncbi:DUF5333 family protein [Alloyangia pacifica]|uniref:Lipoprotein n=1 Tax=Alloyangia pacifica TaxID=311180 RepID=A0A1I6NZ27_9RHOB|nr:DUF5333 family protein [Alloyangia pacifica]SDH56295.1 hypothetical protein SAMN04488245_108104 [Alloyangia pacifica]SFS33207.1 hypothetical protein SAMN04488050_101199 [Alloyangia pacifica]
MRVTMVLGGFGLMAALAMAGCAATPSAGVGGGFSGGSVAGRWEQRVVTISMAERIADACHDEGIYLAPSRWGGAVHRATEEMAAEGTDRSALEAAFQAQDFGALSMQIDRQLASKGVVPGQPQSLCRVGAEEIAAGSDLGQTLKKG